jgi:hypothetical protein
MIPLANHQETTSATVAREVKLRASSASKSSQTNVITLNAPILINLADTLQVEEELLALIAPPVVPGAANVAAFALVVQRTSGPASNDGGVAALVENGEGIFRAVQPHIDPIERDVRSFVLENRRSHEALAFGAHEVGRGGAAELNYQCYQVPDGSNVLIFVISVAGLTTNFGSLRLFVKDLVVRRKMVVSLFFWGQTQHPYDLIEVRSFTKHFEPILEGRLGWGVFIPVDELIKNHSVSPIVWDMLTAFGMIDSVKVGNDAKRGAPKNRNLLTASVEADFARESFFAAMFETA